MPSQLTSERDAIVGVGLLAKLHLSFDPQIVLTATNTITHWRGYNVHSCIVDNCDGEVLALEYNTVHSQEDPLQHGEQRALRAAIARLHQKRPRRPSQTVEEYYRESLFTGPKRPDADPERVGGTLYNTLDPCVMCASTLLITRMRRVAYLVEDSTFEGAWQYLKDKFYSKDVLLHGRLELIGGGSPLIDECQNLFNVVYAKIKSLREHDVKDIHLFDHLNEEAAAAASLLLGMTASDLVTTGEDLMRNKRSMTDLKRLCNFPQ